VQPGHKCQRLATHMRFSQAVGDDGNEAGHSTVLALEV
jgi:hypothetical protein